jgi:hypothetical protein
MSKCRNGLNGSVSWLFLRMLRGFTISRVGTPSLLTPGLSNTRVSKCRKGRSMTKRYQIFAIRKTVMQALPLFSIFRISGPRNAEIYLTTARFSVFQIHDFAIPTADGSWSFNLPDPEILKCQTPKWLLPPGPQPCSKDTSCFMTLGFSMHSAPAPRHRYFQNVEPRNAEMPKF